MSMSGSPEISSSSSLSCHESEAKNLKPTPKSKLVDLIGRVWNVALYPSAIKASVKGMVSEFEYGGSHRKVPMLLRRTDPRFRAWQCPHKVMINPKPEMAPFWTLCLLHRASLMERKRSGEGLH